MRHRITSTLFAITALFAASLLSRPATAMPTVNLAAAASDVSVTENVAWVCGPFRCWWAPRRVVVVRPAPVVVVRRPVVVVPRPFYGYGPVYGWGYGPSYSYRVAGPGWWGYRRAWYGRRHWRRW